MELRDAVIAQVIKAITVASPKGRSLEMRDRPCYGLSLCLSGQITYTCRGERFVSDPTHAVLLPQGATYHINGDKTGDFPVINFTCAEQFCDQLTVIELREREQALYLYEQIRRLLPRPENRAKVMAMFYQLIDLLDTEACPWRLLPAVRYIEEHYCESDMTNAILARECRISEVYLRRLFADAFHCSPKQYVIGIRMQRACQLLAEDTAPITEVARRCGFSDPYHFCRLFRRHEGVTPSVYRKQHQHAQLGEL